MWLNHAGDFGQCAMEISRTNIQARSSQATTVTWSRAQIEESKRYSKDEIDELIARCTKEKRYLDDPNFPGREHLRRYILVDDISSTQKHTQEDKQALTNSGQITHAEGIHLASEGVRGPNSC